jgi:hypothetical protein
LPCLPRVRLPIDHVTRGKEEATERPCSLWMAERAILIAKVRITGAPAQLSPDSHAPVLRCVF